jgi:hypothetical protein
MTVGAARPETPETLRKQIAVERDELVRAVHSMREAADLSGQLRPKLPLLAAAAFAAAFILGGGVGATMRLVFRRGRERRERARLGRFALVDRG